MSWRACLLWGMFTVMTVGPCVTAIKQVTATEPASPPATDSATAGTDMSTKPADRAPQPVPLNPEQTVLLDRTNGRLLVKTTVCLREGLLEMLVCPAKTKEHESILAYEGKVQVVHAGLLALGIKPGHPARFDEKFELPTGPRLKLYVNWTTEGGPQRAAAEDWVRQVTQRYFEAKLDVVPASVPIDKGEETLRYDPNSKDLLWFGPMSAKQRDMLLGHSADEA